MLSIKNLVLQMLSHLEKISTPSFPFLTCGHSLQVGAEPLPHVTEPWELMIDACIWINQSVTLCIPFLESYLYIVNSKIRKVPLLCYLFPYMVKTSSVVEMAILAKKNCRKKCVNLDKIWPKNGLKWSKMA